MLFSFDLVNEIFQNRATLHMLEFLCREPLSRKNLLFGFWKCFLIKFSLRRLSNQVFIVFHVLP